MGAVSTPTLITVAPTGAETAKADAPALPVSLDELVATAKACEAAGAGLIHIHIRDEQARPTLDLARLTDTVAEIGGSRLYAWVTTAYLLSSTVMVPRMARKWPSKVCIATPLISSVVLLRNCSAAVAMEMSSPFTLICATASTVTATP